MEEMRELKEIKEVLTDQIKKISKKGDAISPQELDNAYKAVDIIKDIETIHAMRKAEDQEMEDGYSQDYNYGSMRRPYFHMYPRGSYEGSYDGSYDGGSYGSYDSYTDGGRSNAGRRGRDGDGDGRYSEDYSGRRGRDARTGQYVSRDGRSYDYSGHDDPEKEELKKQLKEMQQKLNQM